MTRKTNNAKIGSLATVMIAVIAGGWSFGVAAPTLAASAEPPEAPLTEPCTGPILGGAGQPLCGTLNPHSRTRTAYYFAYSTETPCTAGARTKAQEVEGEDVGVFGEVSDLEPDTTYAVCLVAVNAGGYSVGNEIVFLTPPAPPVIGELSANAITQNDAVLEVEINSQGLTTTYEFRLESPLCQPALPEHCVASGGSRIATGSVPAGHRLQKASVDLAELGHSLTPSTTYGYSVVAANSAGTTVSPQQSFTTPAEPIIPPPAETPPNHESSTATVTPPPQQAAPPGPPEGPSAAVLRPIAPPASKPSTKRSTRQQRLSAALRACDKVSRTTRARCRRQAQDKYGQALRKPAAGREEFTFER
jgi:hypothetical protein